MAALRCACAWLLLSLVLQCGCAEAPTAAPTPAPTEAPTAAPTPAPTEAPAPSPTPEAKAAPAPSPCPVDMQEDLTDAAQVILADLIKELERPDLQWVNAICAAIFGIAALADGRRTFKVLIICVVGVVVFFVVSSRISWYSHYGIVLKYVAAAEIAVFAAYLTWTGYGRHHSGSSNLLLPKIPQDKAGTTELALGFVLGIYMFHLVQGLALQIPYVDSIAYSSGFDVVVGTLMVLLGCWMICENKGAGRVFGVLVPLFGSSLVISVIGYAVMLTCSQPVVAKYLHTQVPSSCATAVVSFWLMLVSPMASKEVGIFHCLGKEFSMGKTTFQVDRILGMFFMFLLWFICAKIQLKRDASLRSVGNRNLAERMLAPAQSTEDPANSTRPSV